MNTCAHCNVVFSNARAFEKHKKRATGCISWQEMDERFEKLWHQHKEVKEISTNLINHFRERNERLERELAEMKAELANAHAEALMKEFEWDSVSVSAPFMSTKAKRSLRDSIKSSKDFEEIKRKISEIHPTLVVAKIHANNKNLEVVLEDPELTECQVCFERKAQKRGACKVCKTCQVCELCEQMQAIKYHRCAFCNTPF